MALNTLIYTGNALSSNQQHAKLQNILPLRPNHGYPSGDTAKSRFLSRNVSRYNSPKLIQTLRTYIQCVSNTLPNNTAGVERTRLAQNYLIIIDEPDPYRHGKVQYRFHKFQSIKTLYYFYRFIENPVKYLRWSFLQK